MKKIGYILICMAGLAAAGCCGGKNEIEPAEVVVRFHKALTSMGFSEADGYCTEGAVQEYVDAFKSACQEKISKDKEATEAATILLSKDEVIIEDSAGIKTTALKIEVLQSIMAVLQRNYLLLGGREG